MSILAEARARHRRNMGANLERRVYDGVRSKLTLAQIADVALGSRTHRLSQREIDAVQHLWGVR